MADFREEIEKLERDLPADNGQLPLLQGGEVVPIDRHGGKGERNRKR